MRVMYFFSGINRMVSFVFFGGDVKFFNPNSKLKSKLGADLKIFFKIMFRNLKKKYIFIFSKQK